MPDATATVWTIGHSGHSSAAFLGLLRGAEITAVADVRSAPFSRHHPQFNRDELRTALREAGIQYSFLGHQLGGRPADRSSFSGQVADYERMAQAPGFLAGLDRVVDGSGRFRVALMCSEHDPLDCHRCLLVGRALAARGVAVRHILADAEIVSHASIEQRLLRSERRDGEDLFLSPDERLASAYRGRARKVAYAEAADPSEATPS